LELIREIKLINPEIKVIILSAYEKFEYAQEAVRLGAFYYLTKPVNIEKLKTEFTNLKQILEKEKIARHQKKEFSTFASEQFLNNLVNNHYNTNETILKRANEINLCITGNNYCLLRIVLEKTSCAGKELDEGSFQLLKSMAASHLSDYLNNLGKAYVFSSSLTEISILFFPHKIEGIKNDIEKLKDDICSTLNIEIFIGAGKIYENIIQASNSYTEASKALEYRIIKKNNNVLFYQDISEFFKGKSLISQEIEETIISYLSLHSETQLKEYILEIMSNAFKVDQNNKNILYDACIEILLIINKFLTSNVDDKKSLEQNDYLSIKSLLQKQDFKEINEFMIEYLKDSFVLIKNNDEKSSGLVVENAKRYINEHYSEEITLNKLSEVVYVNPMYLSRLFKEKMGENFIDYLTRVRIEHSKQLLADLSLKIYDITEMVGYESRKHFGKTFKEITGMSPKEFRNKLMPQL
jgi:two-component system, response regulator YesN